jgi:peroxiredoxin
MKRLVLLGVALLFPALSDGGVEPQKRSQDDPRNWSPIKIAGQQQMPEFTDIETWLNSDPLVAKKLQGKVVVVHFFTFECINCRHNYPWYKKTWDDLKDKDFVMIGIHTPETNPERNVEALKKKVKNAGLTFPIAVDNKTTMWQRYNNNVWPTVYIFDKQGIARWAWAGELGWKGASGEQQMRRKIDELLQEK